MKMIKIKQKRILWRDSEVAIRAPLSRQFRIQQASASGGKISLLVAGLTVA